jgi:hypothetical protein
MKNKYRSYDRIRKQDLKRLAEIAREDREDLFCRKPEIGKIYKNRIICIALCQGAALHYVDGKNGIKDFDIWTFYRQYPQGPFPYRRNVARDFGNPRFGKTPGKLQFKGKCVDLIGRSIPFKRGQSPIQTIQAYLKTSKNKSPKLLAKKAVVILEPKVLRGAIAWPMR